MEYDTEDVLAQTSEELIVSLRNENNIQQEIIHGLKEQADQDKKQMTLLQMTINNICLLYTSPSPRDLP